MSAMASQITSLTIVYSIVYSGADQRKHQSSASLAFVWGIHRWPVNSPHKGPVTRNLFPFDDVIMNEYDLQADHYVAYYLHTSQDCTTVFTTLTHLISRSHRSRNKKTDSNVRLLGQSRLLNPSDLPCFYHSFFKVDCDLCIVGYLYVKKDNHPNVRGYDCTAYMDYMDLAVRCPRKGVKLIHWLTGTDWLTDPPTHSLIYGSDVKFRATVDSLNAKECVKCRTLTEMHQKWCRIRINTDIFMLNFTVSSEIKCHRYGCTVIVRITPSLSNMKLQFQIVPSYRFQSLIKHTQHHD